ncbi:MAG: MG2 domain-containing protein [Propionivibrio sp.]
MNAASVRQFSPQGEVDRQIRATAVFSSDMVPLGRSDAASPFVVDCGDVKGRARWGDARSWSYTLERPLQAGERCDFRLKHGLTAFNGEVVSGEDGYAFFAPGPWPRSITPRPGGPVEEDQAFLIDASAALKPESVEHNVWCEADGVGNRIPVRLLPDATRNEILGSLSRGVQPGSLAIACSERLPAGAKMRLVWGKGVEAKNGARSSRDERFAYVVRQPFTASLTCEREKANAPCSPLADLRVEFPVPFDVKFAQRARLISPDGPRSPYLPIQEGARENTVTTLIFKGPFPQNAELKIELPSDLRDEAERALGNAASFPLIVRTGVLPPLAKFPGAFGILELKEGGILPVTLRNVEAKLPVADLQMPAANAHRFSERRLTDNAEVIAAIKAIAQFERQTQSHTLGEGDDAYEYVDPYYAREPPFLKGKAGVASQELPKPGGSGEFEVVGIPLQKPGFHIVEIESRMLGAALLATPKPMYVRSTALVTNMAVHLKRGKDNGLVWVTALDSGKPVAGAEVRVSDCKGNSLWQGRSDPQGRALVDVALPASSCDDESFIFASARLGEDYSFVRSDWNEGIEPWRFGVETWGDYEARKIHTVLDRSLFRAGQTVSMKHIARERNSRAFIYPDSKSLPSELVIRHEGSNDEFRQQLNWDPRGIATNVWKIPDSAKRGTYQIELRSAGNGTGGSAYTGEFRISDFRLPVFSGSVQGASGQLVAPRDVPLALALSFLNGGAAKGAPVEVFTTLRPRWPEYKNYEGFHFIVDFDEAGRSAFAVRRRPRGGTPDRRQAGGDARPGGIGQIERGASRAHQGAERTLCGNDFRRSERRDADHPRFGRTGAVRRGGWDQGQGLGVGQRPGRGRSGDARHAGQAGRRRAGQADGQAPYRLQPSQAHRRRLLRLRKSHRVRRSRRDLQGQERFARQVPMRDADERGGQRLPARRNERQGGQRVLRRHQLLGDRARRSVVLRRQPGPHRRDSGEAQLCARRDRAPASAHAVPRGDGAGVDRGTWRHRLAGR